MKGKLILYIDQYGSKFYARTVAELRQKVGGGSVSKMYNDEGGVSRHVGYVVGSLWLRAFAPVAI